MHKVLVLSVLLLVSLLTGLGAVEAEAAEPVLVTVTYDITEPTNQSVIATLVADPEVTVTNNEGKSDCTFTENGEFTFEFVDADGQTGTAIAAVSNIDKVPPTAIIGYSTTELTDQNVAATISFDEDRVLVTNNAGASTYVFTKNGTFAFTYVDIAGNSGSATATVGNISDSLTSQESVQGTISGRVLCDAGNPEYSLSVFAEDLNGSRSVFATPDSAGQYSMTVPIASYRVGVQLFSGSSSLTTWHGSTLESSNSPLVAVDGDGVSGIDIAIPRLSSITGQVSGTDGQPMAGVSVSAIVASSGRSFSWSSTDSLGDYSLMVPAGTYKVRAQVPKGTSWVNVYAPGTMSSGLATVFDVASDSPVTGADIVVPETISISGTVFDSVGTPQVNTYVRVVGLDGMSVASTRTDDLGAFGLSVPQGSYNVGADLAVGLAHTTFWYGSTVVRSASQVVSVDVGTSGSVEILFPQISCISGQVRDVSGGPIIGVEVQAYYNNLSSGSRVSWCTTDSSGNYSLFVPLGSYRVRALLQSATSTTTVYAPGTMSSGSASIVDVASSSPVSNVNITLPELAAVSGQVKDANSTPLVGTTVEASDIVSGNCVASCQSDSLGLYSLQVPAGSYRVSAQLRSGSSWITVYAPGTTSSGSASTVNVNADTPVTGLDIKIPALMSISGQVKGANGIAISGADVSAIDVTLGRTVVWTKTDSLGNYSLLLPTGSYRVRAQIQGLGMYAPGTISSTPAAIVDLTSDEPVTGLNIAFPETHFVSGQVFDSVGVPLPSAYVRVTDLNGRSVSSGRADSVGHYELSIPTGSYRVSADIAAGGSTVMVWYGSTVVSSESPIITVESGDFSGIDISCPQLGSIMGRLQSAVGQPAMSAVEVWAYDAITGSGIAWSRIGASGDYTLLVPAGAYRVGLQVPSGSSWITVYAPGTTNYSAATVLNVTVDQPIAGLDVVMPQLISITGQVRDAEGGPSAGVTVRAYDVGSNGSSVTSSQTDSLGIYSLQVPAGAYRVGAQAPSGSFWITVYAPGTTSSGSASTVNVNADTPVTGVDIEIPALMSISGQVRGANGIAISGADISAIDIALGRTIIWSETDSLGNYSLLLPTGSYRVMAQVQGLSVYAPGTISHASAGIVNLTFGEPVTGLNITFPETHFVSGQVFDSVGVPLPSAYVRVTDLNGGSVSSGNADSAGHYELSIPTGSYRVNADIAAGGSTVTVWYGSTVVSSESPMVTVGSGDVSGIDISCPQLVSITGRLQFGQPAMSAVEVWAYDAITGSGIARSGIGASGDYTLLVPAGSYKIAVRIPSGSSRITVYAPGTTNYGAATVLNVTVDQPIAGPDIVIPQLIGITGQVRDAEGGPSAGVTVRAYDVGSNGSSVTSCQTDSLGIYRLQVPAGVYRVGVQAPSGSSSITVYAPGTTSSGSASTVNVNADTPVTGLDIEIPALMSISGEVRGANGIAISGVDISAIDVTLGRTIVWSKTDSLGNYSLSLPTGSYRVRAQVQGLSVYAPGTISYASAGIVDLTSDEPITGLNIAFPETHFVSGQVLDSVGVPLPSAYVQATDLNGQSVSSGNADSAGHYELSIPTGSYRVRANITSGGSTVTVWYGSTVVSSDSPMITVESGDVSGIDISCPQLVSITGRLQSAVGQPTMASVVIGASDAATGSESASCRTNASGDYTLLLPVGSYRLAAQIQNGDSWINVYAPGTTDHSAATILTVTADQPIVGLDIEMLELVTISGQVTAADGEPSVGTSVSAYDAASGNRLATCQTDSTGSYSLSVPIGSYRVSARVWSGTASMNVYAPGTMIYDLATIVDVASGAPLHDLDIEIPEFCSISGRVTDAEGQPKANVGVTANDATTWDFTSVRTDSLGYYCLLVQAGSYRIKTSIPNGQNWVHVYASGTLDSVAATIVDAAPGAPISGLDIVIPELWSISGQVQNVNGDPVANVGISAYDMVNKRNVTWSQTDSSGNYTLLVTAGPYLVSTSVWTGFASATLYAPGTVINEMARTVLIEGAGVTDVNISIPELHIVSGTVCDDLGEPLIDVSVQAGSVDSGFGAGTAHTNANGEFSFLLPAGTYRFNTQIVEGTGWLNAYYGDYYGDLWGSAPSVVVSEPMANIDIHHPRISMMNGHLFNPNGAPISDAMIIAIAGQGQHVKGLANTNSTGYYSMPVPEGQYDVGVCTPDGGWNIHLNSVVVGTGVTVDGVDIHLQHQPQVTLSMPIQEVRVTDHFAVAVDASAFEGLRAVDLRLSYDPAILRPTAVHTSGLTNGFMVESNLNEAGVVVIAMANATPVTGSGELLRIDFEAVAGAIGVSPICFEEVLLNDGAISVSPVDGQVTVVPVFSIDGTVHYYAGGQSVGGVAMQLGGGQSLATETDSVGQYSFADVRAGEHTLTPSKADEANDISAYDASLILQAAVGKITLSLEQGIAADVDRNGHAAAMDASYVLQHAAGLLSLPFPDSNSIWTFTPSMRQFSGLDISYLDQDFTAILVGDVSGSWQAADVLTALGGESPIELNLGTVRVTPGGSATVSLLADTNGGALYSADLVINFDPDVVQGVEVTASSQANGFSVVSNYSVPGQLIIAVASGTPLTGEAQLLELSFHVTDIGGKQSGLVLTRADINEHAVLQVENGQVIVAIQGDADLNNVIDIVDLAAVATQYGLAGPAVDMNGDGLIDVYDLVIVSRLLAR